MKEQFFIFFGGPILRFEFSIFPFLISESNYFKTTRFEDLLSSGKITDFEYYQTVVHKEIVATGYET
jgi:hypothetical protein